jgi:hypothetical protein
MNVYSVLNDELNRMHDLMKLYLSLPREPTYASTSLGGSNMPHAMVTPIYKRIIEIQDILLKAVSEHDALVQEKVAELAMMGKEQ